jgi:hypothetical protein
MTPKKLSPVQLSFREMRNIKGVNTTNWSIRQVAKLVVEECECILFHCTYHPTYPHRKASADEICSALARQCYEPVVVTILELALPQLKPEQGSRVFALASKRLDEAAAACYVDSKWEIKYVPVSAGRLDLVNDLFLFSPSGRRPRNEFSRKGPLFP